MNDKKQNDFSHLDEKGLPNMVDISSKINTKREAVASCIVKLSEKAYKKIQDNSISKGNVINVSKLAAISASKKTYDLIPLCHQIPLNKVDVNYYFDDKNCSIIISSFVSTDWKTGVEMEALVAVSIAALTIYDMCKSIDKSIEITEIVLKNKKGGKSGDFERE